MSIGAPVAISLTVSPVVDGSIPTGTVQLVSPDAPYEVFYNLQLSNGSASTLIDTLPLGNYSLYAIYSGDSNFGGSTSGLSAINLVNTVNGCTPTQFQAFPNPIITTSSTGSMYIRATAPCGYDIRVGSPDGQLFSSTYGDSFSYAIGWVTDGMMFYMQQSGNTTSQGTMAAIMVSLRPFDNTCVIANFSATPNPVISYTGLGVATINVNAGCPYVVRVGSWDGPITMSGQALTTATTGEWITNGQRFYLETPPPDNTVLDTLTINVEQVAPPCQIQTFSASPLAQLIFYWFPGAIISVDSACSYDVREGTPSGALIGSGTGTNSYPVPGVANGTVFCLQPKGDTKGEDTLAITTAWTPPRQQGPVITSCFGGPKRYCY